MFQLGFVDVFCRDTQPADIRVISSPVAATQLSMNAGERSQPQTQSARHYGARTSKYPPAKPRALVLELLKAAYPCRTSQASLPL